MKKLFGWLLRIACFAIIGAAVYTLVGCLMTINDDHSAAAVMGTTQTVQNQTLAVETEPVQSVAPTVVPDSTQEPVEENPTVIVYTDGKATVNRSYCTVTAAFGNIVNSIVADLSWYLDGVLVAQETNRMLVEGSIVSTKVELDVENAQSDSANVTLEISYDGKVLTGDTDIVMEVPTEESNTIVIKTAEIPVEATGACDVYTESDLEHELSKMEKGDTGLLLAYESDNGGLRAIRLLLGDGTSGWVSAEDVEISQEDCTTDEDYTAEEKVAFVNDMRYDSQTSYLVWVSLYTQKVNVFQGYQENWELVESFDCSTGVNDSPTTTGVFTYSIRKDRWDLGTTYVEPVLIFNGGEAFTSQPYDTDTEKIVDDTMGQPASGGSVRMLEEDIAWMAENLPLGSLVVVY